MIELEAGVDPARVVDLRRAVLRPHQEPEASVYPTDGDAGAVHWLLLEDGRPVGCASVYRELLNPQHGLRFRGMAVLPEWRGTGLGRRLLDVLQEHARAERTGLWCNARVTAGSFYEAMGLRGHGEVFDLPPLGPHRIYCWTPPDR